MRQIRHYLRAILTSKLYLEPSLVNAGRRLDNLKCLGLLRPVMNDNGALITLVIFFDKSTGTTYISHAY